MREENYDKISIGRFQRKSLFENEIQSKGNKPLKTIYKIVLPYESFQF